MAEQLYTVYTTAVALGALHGSDPGHGWPLAIAYGVRRRSVAASAVASLVIAAGHLASSVAVVFAVWLLGAVAKAYAVLLQAGAGAVLVVLGIRGILRLVRGEGEGAGAAVPASMGALARYAFLLGFAHEEEVALATIVLMGADPLVLAMAYSLAVTAAMLAWTLLGHLAASVAPSEKAERFIDAASSLVLVAIGVYAVAEAATGHPSLSP